MRKCNVWLVMNDATRTRMMDRIRYKVILGFIVLITLSIVHVFIVSPEECYILVHGFRP